MPRYSNEHKEAVLRTMLLPHNRALAEEGISEATLSKWRRETRDKANCSLMVAVAPWAGARRTNSPPISASTAAGMA